MGKPDAAGKKSVVTTNSTSRTSSNRRPTSTTNSTSSTSSNPRPTSSDGTRRIGSFKASFLIDKRDTVVYKAVLSDPPSDEWVKKGISPGQTVILKMYKKAEDNRSQSQKRELYAAHYLPRHATLAKIYGYFHYGEPKQLCIVMERVPGETVIEGYNYGMGGPTAEDKVKILILCSIIDENNENITHPRGFSGTEAYFAPEMCYLWAYKRNKSGLKQPLVLTEKMKKIMCYSSKKADVWALGITSLEMLADGEYMFDLPESEEDRIKLLTDLIPNKEFNIKLKDLRLSPLLKDLLNGMLQVDPEARLSMREVHEHPFVQNRSQVAAATPQARQRPAQARTSGTKTTNSTSQSTVQSPVIKSSRSGGPIRPSSRVTSSQSAPYSMVKPGPGKRDPSPRRQS
ncbi:serine threonine- kinase [Pyrrhoderma noxium]|uniref:Serine threonine-kinase n=1 Tax=Pyrrhoderma noxium TaxID=2282107 RepID=A0A286UD64_9AGAM|nr:serine threonine- kinase [Pyrrhoderma noxium]